MALNSFTAAARGLDGRRYRIEANGGGTSVVGGEQWLTFDSGESRDTGQDPIFPTRLRLFLQDVDLTPMYGEGTRSVGVEVYDEDSGGILVYDGYMATSFLGDQPYLPRSVTEFRALDGLGTLERDAFDTGDWNALPDSYIGYTDAITEILSKLGTLDVEFGVHWYPDTGLSSSQNPVRQVGFESENYRQERRSNGPYLDMLTVLRDLLLSQGLTIRQVRRDLLEGAPARWHVRQRGAMQQDGSIKIWHYDTTGTEQSGSPRTLDRSVSIALDGSEVQTTPERDFAPQLRRVTVTHDHETLDTLFSEGGFEAGSISSLEDWSFPSDGDIDQSVIEHGNANGTPATRQDNTYVLEIDQPSAASDGSRRVIGSQPLDEIGTLPPRGYGVLSFKWVTDEQFRGSLFTIDVDDTYHLENFGINPARDVTKGTGTIPLSSEVVWPIPAGATLPVEDLGDVKFQITLTARAEKGDTVLEAEIPETIQQQWKIHHFGFVQTQSASRLVDQFDVMGENPDWKEHDIYFPFVDQDGDRVLPGALTFELWKEPNQAGSPDNPDYYDDFGLRIESDGSKLDQSIFIASVADVGETEEEAVLLGSGPNADNIAALNANTVGKEPRSWGLGNDSTNWTGSGLPLGLLYVRERLRYQHEGNERFRVVTLSRDGQGPTFAGDELVTLDGTEYTVHAVEYSPAQGTTRVTLLELTDYGLGPISLSQRLAQSDDQSTSGAAGGSGAVSSAAGVASIQGRDGNVLLQSEDVSEPLTVDDTAAPPTIDLGIRAYAGNPSGTVTPNYLSVEPPDGTTDPAILKVDVLDEDDMASDSVGDLATQSSIKSYVDNESGATLDLGDDGSANLEAVTQISVVSDPGNAFAVGDEVTGDTPPSGELAIDFTPIAYTDREEQFDDNLLVDGGQFRVKSGFNTYLTGSVHVGDSTTPVGQLDVTGGNVNIFDGYFWLRNSGAAFLTGRVHIGDSSFPPDQLKVTGNAVVTDTIQGENWGAIQDKLAVGAPAPYGPDSPGTEQLQVDGSTGTFGVNFYGAGGWNIRSSGGTGDLLIHQNFASNYSVFEARTRDVDVTDTTVNSEATLALTRTDSAETNVEFIDLYNNGYYGSNSVKYGLRIQKRGDGQLNPFKFEWSDGVNKPIAWEILPPTDVGSGIAGSKFNIYLPTEFDLEIVSDEGIVSDTFNVSTLGGSGYVLRRLDDGSNDTQLYADELIANRFRVAEFLVNQITFSESQAISAGFVVSDVLSHNGSGLFTVQTDTNPTVAPGDLCRAKRYTDGQHDSRCRVDNVTRNGSDSTVEFQLVDDALNAVSPSTSNNAPAEGFQYARLGNYTDTDRQNLIYLTASDASNPRIDFYEGVDTFNAFGASSLSTRVGNLSGLSKAESDSMGLFTEVLRATGSIYVGDLAAAAAQDTSGTYLRYDSNGLQIRLGGAGDLDDSIATIEADVSDNEAAISTNTTIINDNGLTSSTNIEQRVTDSEANISSNTSIITDNGLTSSTNIEQRVTDSEANISSNTSIITDNGLTSTTNIEQRVTDSEANISSNTSIINDNGLTSSTNIEQRVTDSEANISSNTSIINDNGLTSTTNIEQRVTDSEANISSNTTIIDDNGLTSSTNIEQRVTDNEAEINLTVRYQDTTEGGILVEANATGTAITLDADTVLVNKLEGPNSEYTINLDDGTFLLNKGKIGGVAANTVRRGSSVFLEGFEAGVDDWVETSGAIVAAQTNGVYSGDTAATFASQFGDGSSSSGTTDGVHIEIPEEIALQFAGAKIEVAVYATKPQQGAADNFAVAYSTDDVGNSGWNTFATTSDWVRYSFTYEVPEPNYGGSDYLAILGDADAGGDDTYIDRISIRPQLSYVGDVADLDEITSTYIGDGEIVTRTIAADAIQANEIDAGTITADEVDVGNFLTDSFTVKSGGEITNTDSDFRIDADGFTLRAGDPDSGPLARRVSWEESGTEIARMAADNGTIEQKVTGEENSGNSGMSWYAKRFNSSGGEVNRTKMGMSYGSGGTYGEGSFDFLVPDTDSVISPPRNDVKIGKMGGDRRGFEFYPNEGLLVFRDPRLDEPTDSEAKEILGIGDFALYGYDEGDSGNDRGDPDLKYMERKPDGSITRKNIKD